MAYDDRMFDFGGPPRMSDRPLSDQFYQGKLYKNGRAVKHELDQFLFVIPAGHRQIRPHPLNYKIYGHEKPDADLMLSIKEHGIIHPIVVSNQTGYILSGCRRWRAYCALKMVHPTTRHKDLVVILKDFTPLEEEQFLLEANRQREKTAEQKGREFKERKRIEKEFAKIRMLAGKMLNPSANLRKGRAAVLAAMPLGLKPRTAEKLEIVIDAADAGSTIARTALNKLNATGRGVDSAYQSIRKPEKISRREKIKNEVAKEKAAQQALARSLQSLFPVGTYVHVDKHRDGFHLWFNRISEQRVREIAQRLSWQVESRAKAASAG
jgi:ParB-like chromosome segregation protein Spo0J